MADLEKVIKGLECCLRESEHIDDNPCADCPYYDIDSGLGGKCIDDKDKDALALLKEHEELKSRHKILVDECDKMYYTLKEKNKTIEELEDDLATTKDMLNHYLNGNE